MIVAMMQPTFLPWAGYFGQIDAADRFVLLDDFQFQRRSFHHRNRLFVSRDRVGWVTVPVGHTGRSDRPLLNEVRPALSGRAQDKLLRQLLTVYGGSEHFSSVLPLLERAITRQWPSLADLNISVIGELCQLIGLESSFVRSAELGSAGSRSVRVAELLRTVGAEVFIAAAGAEGWLREDGLFPIPGVDVYFQRYEPARYSQRHSSQFVPYLSIVDMLLQIGPERTLERVRAGATEFVDWNNRPVVVA
jgi:hypothetical protein